MSHSHATALSYALLAAGLILGSIGTLGHSDAIWHGGLVLILTSLPAIGVQAIRRTHHATEDRLAAEFNAGYLLGLDHAARGLLDPPAAPQPGPGEPHLPRNVIRLRPDDADDGPEQKAQ
jgi:hypothetical protein